MASLDIRPAPHLCANSDLNFILDMAGHLIKQFPLVMIRWTHAQRRPSRGSRHEG
jgi:hypothetical protein